MAESTAKTNGGSWRVAGTAGLARHLGVSRWTVSRVLNGHSGVRESTRRRVLEAVEQLGFEPNKLARGLRGVPSGVVGVSFPHLEALVLAQKSQELRDALSAAGYRGIFEMPRGDPEMEAAVVRHFLSINVDGIVLIGSTLEPDAGVFEEVRARDVAIVAVDPRHALKIPRVSLDRGKAMELKLRHLHGLGHRRIALLGLGSDDMYPGIRMRGLRRAAQLLEMDYAGNFIRLDDPEYPQQAYEYGAHLAGRVMEIKENRPTALFCLNDRIAIGAMRTLQESGYRIPEDYSIIGFDNIPETAWSHPPLTTIDQNIFRLMEIANRVLWGSREREKPIHRKVPPRLIERGSTGRAPVK